MFVVLKKSFKQTKLRTKPRYVLEEAPVLAKAAVAFVDVLGMQKLLRTRSLLSVANGILRSFASRSMASVPILSRDKSLISEVVQHTGMRPANIVTHLFVSDTLLIACLVDPWERTLKKAAVDAIWHLALMVAQLMALNALDGFRKSRV